MKQVVLILMLSSTLAYAQKTTRKTISETRSISITQTVTERTTGNDTISMMMGQNGKYTHITDIVIVKHGTLRQINDLLTECFKFLAEKDGTSLDYEGNTIMVMTKGQLMVFGTGRDKMDYILLNKNLITRLQADLKPYLQ